MKLLSIPLLALAASAFVIPNDETIESLSVQDQAQEHPFWKNVKDPARFWEELEDRFNSVADSTKDKLAGAAEYVHDVAVEYSEDFQTAFAGQAWLESVDEDDEHHPPHHGRPHHKPPHHGPPHHGPPDHEPPHHGPPHRGPPGHEPPHHGPPHRGPPHHEPPHHGPPHRGPPGHEPPHHGPGKRPHHRPCHKMSNKTVYGLIAESKYTTKLAKLINEFPDLVELLNGTKANFTVFAPTDEAFARIPEHAPKPPKEFLKKLLLYHVSPDFYPAGRILVTKTIPTALEDPLIGNNSQRLSTQIGFFKLTVNFYSRIVAINHFGTNGVIHGINSILLPPPKVVDILDLVPTEFSTLSLALEKTGLYELYNNTDLHTGGTLFAPSNFAFALLGPRINAFLFSPYGLKYLKALILYHSVPDITLYSDAIYKAGGDSSSSGFRIPRGRYHIDMPTGLEGKSLSVDVGRFGRLITIRINGFIDVSISDGIAADGVLHVLSQVLIPPREPGAPAESAEDMSLEEFQERLAPYVEAADDEERWELK